METGLCKVILETGVEKTFPTSAEAERFARFRVIYSKTPLVQTVEENTIYIRHQQ